MDQGQPGEQEEDAGELWLPMSPEQLQRRAREALAPGNVDAFAPAAVRAATAAAAVSGSTPQQVAGGAPRLPPRRASSRQTAPMLAPLAEAAATQEAELEELGPGEDSESPEGPPGAGVEGRPPEQLDKSDAMEVDGRDAAAASRDGPGGSGSGIGSSRGGSHAQSELEDSDNQLEEGGSMRGGSGRGSSISSVASRPTSLGLAPLGGGGGGGGRSGAHLRSSLGSRPSSLGVACSMDRDRED